MQLPNHRHLTKLLIGLQILLALSVAGGFLSHVYSMHQATLAQRQQEAEAQVRVFEEQLTQTLNLSDLTLQSLPESMEMNAFPAHQAAHPHTLGSELEIILHRLLFFRSLSVADAQGAITASSNPENIGQQIATDDFEPRQAESDAGNFLRIGPPWGGRDFAGGQPTTRAEPISSARIGFIPLLREADLHNRKIKLLAALNPDYFLNHFARYIDPAMSSVEVVSYDGTLLLSSREDALTGSTHISGEILQLLHANEIGSIAIDNSYASPKITAYRASRSYPLFVLVHVDRDQALAQWHSETRRTLSIGGLALFALLLLSSLLIARVRRGLREEEQMHKERQLAAQVFEHSTNGILITGPDARIVAVNPCLETLSGYTANELLGENPRIFSSGQHDPAFYQAMWADLTSNGQWRGFVVNLRKSGEIIEEWLTISSVRNSAGQLTNYVGVFEDISLSRQRDRLLRRLSQAVEQSPVSIVITNLEPAIEYANPQFLRTSGFQYDEVIGQNPNLLQSGLTPQTTYHALWETLSSGGIWEGEFINKRKDGTTYHERAVIAPIRDDNGQTTHYLATKLDISEQRQQAIRLERQLAALQALNDIAAITTPEPLETLRAALQIAAAHLHLEFGIISQIEPDKDSCRIEVQVSPNDIFRDNQRLSLGTTYCNTTLQRNDVLAISNANESPFNSHPALAEFGLTSYLGAPVYVNGKTYGTINFSSKTPRNQEFTPAEFEFMRLLARWAGAFIERKQALSQLIDARLAAEAASQTKGSFLANMSHELRTPMSGVLGMTDLLLYTELTAEQRDFATTIKHSASGLLSLINDILDFSKIEASKLQLENVAFSPTDELRDIVMLLGHEIRRKDVTLTTETAPELPETLLGDPGRLRQILINLIGNAIKFTPAGTITVQITSQLVPTRPDQIQLDISISDTGIGMSPEVVSSLFSPFYQGDTSTTRRFGGTGLGLAICKRLAELMGGQISAESTPDVGSTFRVQLPFTLASPLPDDAD
jgi:PAS domain S-box-containing protein